MRSWEPPFLIGDRGVTADDLAFIKAMVWEFRYLSLTELVGTICENLPWKAPNGKVKVNGRRLLLEEMAGAGLIVLPSRKGGGDKKDYRHTKVPPLPGIEIKCSLSHLTGYGRSGAAFRAGSLECTMAASSLGFRQPFGAHQRYWIHSRAKGLSRVLGAMLFAPPAKKVADRDAWIGWTDLERKRFRYRLLGNSRFLILLGIQVPHLASHVLGLAVRRKSKQVHGPG